MAQAPTQNTKDEAKVERLNEGFETEFSDNLIEDEAARDIVFDGGTEFTDLQLEDYTWKVGSRKIYGRVLIGLLLVQNAFVFGLVGYAIVTGNIQDLQLIFAVLVTATLGETAYMVKVIVEWLFRDIQYPRG